MNFKKLIAAILTAAALWFAMFSPWTGGGVNFWLEMSCSAMILATIALSFTPDRKALFSIQNPLAQLVLGIGIAAALWGIFLIGDRVSRLLFDFARPQVDSVYSMKTGLPDWGIAALLLLVIGPAEELFWRGFIQRSLTKLLTAGPEGPIDKKCQARKRSFAAFLLTTAVYALVHVWSFNFMLVMAALVAGAVWGFIYFLKPSLLPALVVSHAVWDAMVFVIFPI